jgi:hypothetical protein
MRQIITGLAIALALAGCSALSTLEGTTVSPTAMIVAVNAFDGVESTATNYIRYCTPKPQSVGCSATAIQQLVPAIRSGRIARNNLEGFVQQNPGALGPVGLYNALTAATQTLSQIEATYNVGSK